ncbi:hypothetical protein chiPu_0007369 [Chiloscyllium punctatum]|uniref:Uncharacterized protein n=1 Tax=Chiloscyllium punctatum TaxID=137246 RepID=A0A401SEV8_CHIPU|nr:hypothetical protein [Chiloscyllium punctatum]
MCACARRAEAAGNCSPARGESGRLSVEGAGHQSTRAPSLQRAASQPTEEKWRRRRRRRKRVIGRWW